MVQADYSTAPQMHAGPTGVVPRKRYERWMGEQGLDFRDEFAFLVLKIVGIGLCYLSQMPVPIAGI